MKRALRLTVELLRWLPVLFTALLFVGFRWGLTPLPKPPPGVRLDPLSLPLKPDELTTNNAAFNYLKAAQLIRSYRQAEESEKQMEAVLMADFSDGTKAMKQTISDCKEALTLVRHGTTMGFCRMPWVDCFQDSTDYWKPFHQCAFLESCAGRLALHDGKFDEAANHFLTEVKFGNDCTKGGSFLSFFAGYSMTRRGFTELRMAATDGKPTTNSLVRVIARLNELQGDVQSPAETLRYDLIDVKRICDLDVMTNDWCSFVMSKSMVHRVAEAAFGDFIKEAEKPFWQCEVEKVADKWWHSPEPDLLTMLNRPMVTFTVDMSTTTLDLLLKKAVCWEAELRATIVVCALRSYIAAHGKPPEQLSELVPEFLSAVPTDPFDGKPLRYRREGDVWVVWSVGSDRIDNSAEWHESKYNDERNYRSGGDIYFKSTEARDDFARYLKNKNPPPFRGHWVQP